MPDVQRTNLSAVDECLVFADYLPVWSERFCQILFHFERRLEVKRKYKILITLAVVTVMFLLCTVPAFALTESEVQDQVNSAGRESVTGNVWVWFLCAIAFLKVSQKIDSFNMMNKSHIGWCDFSWNPITGCKKDCDFSYGKRQTRRLCGTVQLNKSNPQIHWNKEQKIAVLPAPFHTESDSVIQFPVGFSPPFTHTV